MSRTKTRTSIALVTFCIGLAGAGFAWTRTAASPTRANERVRIVASQLLPKLDADHLKAVLVEVRYAPGEASSPHTHPCAVIGYVVEGTLRTQVKGEPEKTYRAGESFYEAPNGVHLLSANASSTEPAKLLAYLICSGDMPLSVDVSESTHAQGASK
jgi:quercetin dioxygenase-like cupin family protein